jgi:hypothetical protein
VTTQINNAYVVLLAAEWQGFCRQLHSEAADVIANAVDPGLRVAIRAALTSGRRMDRGNADADDVAGDFSKFGMNLWPEVRQLHKWNDRRQARLRQLYVWRNAIVHQDFNFGKDHARLVKGTGPTLDWAKVWRAACVALADHIDRAVGRYVASLVGTPPW